MDFEFLYDGTKYDRLIAFDIDGVILDLFPHLRELFLDHYNHDIHPQREYDFKIPDQDVNDVNALWQLHLLTLTRNSELIPGSKLINKFLRYEELLFITSRPEESLLYTRRHLESLLGHGSFNICCTNLLSKVDAVKKYKPQFFVDDRFQTIREVSFMVECGMLFNQDWNMGRQLGNNEERVLDMQGVIEHIIFIYYQKTCPNFCESGGEYYCKKTHEEWWECSIHKCDSWHFVKDLYFDQF